MNKRKWVLSFIIVFFIITPFVFITTNPHHVKEEINKKEMSYVDFLSIFEKQTSDEQTINQLKENANYILNPYDYLSQTEDKLLGHFNLLNLRFLKFNIDKDLTSKDINYVKYQHKDPSFEVVTDDAIYDVLSPQNGNLKEFLLLNNVKIKEPDYILPLGKLISDIIITLLPLTIFILLLFYLFRSRMGSMSKVGSEVASTHNISKYSFNSIAGHKETKEDLMPLISFLKNPNKYSILGARLPKGVILYGPPGTGKTLLAKAMAGEAGIPFFATNASEFVEMYVGVGASRIRNLFKKARENTPCIIFIDELESLARDSSLDNNSEKEQTLKQLLTELDGFSTTEGILVVGATNHLEKLNKTFVRSGRFDRHVAVGLPDKDERLEILKIHAKNKKISESISLKEIAQKTTGFSGADLEKILNEAALFATLNKKTEIDKNDIDDAFYKTVMKGYKKSARHKNKEQLSIVAWHEAGHALVAKNIANLVVNNVNIIPSTSGAGGVTFIEPKNEGLQSKIDLENEIKISYAGRIAEELYCQDKEQITTGAYNDIQQATEKIKTMIMLCGMSDMGMLNLSSFTNSEQEVLKEAKKISKRIYDETYEYLLNNKIVLERLANALLEKENLEKKEIEQIIQ